MLSPFGIPGEREKGGGGLFSKTVKYRVISAGGRVSCCIKWLA